MSVHRENPRCLMVEQDGRWWVRDDAGPEWVHLGYAPTPRTTWQTVRYHLGHGLVMGYRLRDVVAWSWRNRRSFANLDAPGGAA